MYVDGIYKCLVMKNSESHTFLSITCAQNTIGKNYKEWIYYDLCSQSIYSYSGGYKITWVKKHNDTVKETGYELRKQVWGPGSTGSNTGVPVGD